MMINKSPTKRSDLLLSACITNIESVGEWSFDDSYLIVLAPLGLKLEEMQYLRTNINAKYSYKSQRIMIINGDALIRDPIDGKEIYRTKYMDGASPDNKFIKAMVWNPAANNLVLEFSTYFSPVQAELMRGQICSLFGKDAQFVKMEYDGLISEPVLPSQW